MGEIMKEEVKKQSLPTSKQNEEENTSTKDKNEEIIDIEKLDSRERCMSSDSTAVHSDDECRKEANRSLDMDTSNSYITEIHDGLHSATGQPPIPINQNNSLLAGDRKIRSIDDSAQSDVGANCGCGCAIS